MSMKESSFVEHWGLPRHIISMEKYRFLHYMTDCHSPLSGVLRLHVAEQEESLLQAYHTHSILSFRWVGLTQPY